jgi:hypothetical protein
MDFKELIKLRQSNRAYQDRAVEKEKIGSALRKIDFNRLITK